MLGRLDDLGTRLATAQAAERTFVMSGDSQLLAPYDSAERAIAGAVAGLGGLDVAGTAQRVRLALLRRLVRERIAAMRRAVDVRRDSGYAAAAALVLGPAGRQLQERLEAVTGRMRQSELAVLARRVDEARSSARQTLIIVLLSTGSAVVLLILAILRINADLSWRRRSEEALRASEARLQSFLDEAQDLIQITDPDGRFMYTNISWQRVFGYGPEELRSLRFADLIHEESREAFRDMDRVVRNGLALSSAELVLRTKAGQRIVVSANVNPHVDTEGGETVRALLRDITTEREVEAELQVQQAYLQQLFESAPEAIVVLNAEGRILNANPEFTTTFGYDLAAARGRPVADLIVPPHRRKEARELVERLRLGETVRQEMTLQRRNGDLLGVSVLGAPIHVQGQPVALYAIFRDITERVRTEAMLRDAKETAEAANRSKSDFLARMSHELRTPLNSVIGFANVLRRNRSENLSEQELSYLQRIVVNGEHLLGLINDILDLSKIEAGRMDVELRATPLEDLLSRIAAQFEPQLKDRPVALVVDVPEGLPPLRTDPDRMAQILINLIGNAVKFTENGEVRVRVEADPATGRPAAIEIRDSGIGIAPDRLEAIFKAFEQGEATTTRRYGGTGLGLAISRSLAELLGYRITASSQVGQGSTFRVELTPTARPVPERPAAAATPAPPARAPRPTGEPGPHALIIDDDADSRLLLAEFLREAGCRTTEARSGEEGLRLAVELVPDIITLDLMLPVMSGVEVLQTLKRRPELASIPVIIVSIVASEERAELGDAAAVLDKPISRDELVSLVRQRLGTYRNSRTGA